MADEESKPQTEPQPPKLEAAKPAPAAVATSASARGRWAPALAGFAGGLVGGIAVAALLAAASVAEWPWLRSRLAAEIAPPPAGIADLERRVAALEGASHSPASDSSAPATADLARRVGALEAAPRGPAPAAPDPRIDELAAKTEKLAADIASLRGATPDAATMTHLVERAEAAAQTARDVAAKRQSVEALLLAVGQLRDAVERGDPYAPELAAARKVAPAEAAGALDALDAGSAAGVPRAQALIDAFPATADSVVRAALAPQEGDDIWQKLRREAAGLVSLRRIDGHGDDPPAVAARAERMVREGNLAGAVDEMSALSGAPALAAKSWVAGASLRVAAERALSDLAAKTAAATSAAGG